MLPATRNLYLMQIQNPISGKFFLPLPLGYLWSYCQTFKDIRENYELKGIFIFREKIREYLEVMKDPDVVGISTYVWNWEVSKTFARLVKEKWPNCKIVMGGPHVPYKINFFEELPYVDFVVTYEGEEQFAELLQTNLSATPDFDAIVGLLSRTKTYYVKRKSQMKIEEIPSPYLTGFFKPLLEGNNAHLFNMIMETNRGCPYTCSFCDMQDSFYTKLRQFELSRVKEELNWAAEHKIEYIECADSNFGIFARDIEIIQHLCDLKNKQGYPRSFNFTSAKNQPENVEKIQRLLVDNGLRRGISVSLQSFNPKVLDAIKRWNSKKEDLEIKLARYEKQGYESYIELIIGLPEETKDSWLSGIGQVLDAGYKGSLLMHPLSVVPNTPFSDPDYVRKYGLKYTLTRSPAQGFCYGTESPEERETICYESNTMSLDDWKDCYIFGKTTVGAYYYHGLVYFIVEYLNQNHNISRSDFFVNLLEYSKKSDEFIGAEYKLTSQLLEQTLFDLRPWGRKVFGEHDMYWSDQAAAAMSALKNYSLFSEDILGFVRSRYQIENESILRDLFRFNFEMLEQPGLGSRTFSEFDYNWSEYFSNKQELRRSGYRYEFRRREFSDYRDHALNVFWYGRKSRRCFVEGVTNANI